MFTPPSGRLMRRTIFAAVPISKRSAAPGFCASSVFVMTRPMKLSAAMAFSTVSASWAEGSISGREDAGEDRLSAKGDDEQARGQYLVRRDDGVVAHSFSPVVSKRVRMTRGVKSSRELSRTVTLPRAADSLL